MQDANRMAVVGAIIWAVTFVCVRSYKKRLREAEIAVGRVVYIDDRFDGEYVFRHPVIEYANKKGEFSRFCSSWGAGERRWKAGEHVKVKIIDGKPELHDSNLATWAFVLAIILGGCLIFAN